MMVNSDGVQGFIGFPPFFQPPIYKEIPLGLLVLEHMYAIHCLDVVGISRTRSPGIVPGLKDCFK